ncbi:Rieske (2Fe-2S) protein [Alienimonas sp. DA493]|uniref:Rieske (2Fe-2S) protein n=1 Tax=Alienimonas sp. DA493 TaxID=3373605 RepID=UPI003754D845
MSRVRLCSVHDVRPGAAGEFPVGDRLVAVFRLAEPRDGREWFALDGLCPHAGGPLGAGALTGCVVTCPWHGWQFDVTDGSHTLTPQIQHESFPVIVEEDAVWVDLPEPE